MSTASFRRLAASRAPNVFTFMPARPSVCTAISQMGRDTMRLRVTSSSVGQSITAGL